jgi:hypothetical protein
LAPIACLGYQLLSALAGTLADGRLEGATRAVLLVQEFVTSETDDENHATNAWGLDDFICRLNRRPPGRTETADGWITDAVTVRSDDEWLPRELPVHIAKLVTNMRGEVRTGASGGR